MGYSDIVADTDIERIEKKLDFLHERQNKLADAINGCNQNIIWIVDNCKGIFQMFQTPAFMASLPAMMNPSAMAAAANSIREENGGE